jgi:shikimate kinase
MPVIATFFGIVVTMYFFDNRRHKVPHIHVQAESDEAVISIPDGEVLQGSVRKNKLRLVQAWIEIHQEELMKCWELAVVGKPTFGIEPLR